MYIIYIEKIRQKRDIMKREDEKNMRTWEQQAFYFLVLGTKYFNV